MTNNCCGFLTALLSYDLIQVRMKSDDIFPCRSFQDYARRLGIKLPDAPGFRNSPGADTKKLL